MPGNVAGKTAVYDKRNIGAVFLGANQGLKKVT